MNLYNFVVNFVGTVPSEFEFVYVILTLILSIIIFGTFSTLFYIPIRILRGLI